ncbi:hypothetical protein ACHWQZ_G016541 [Mnemiopsis leidyi]
MTKPNPLSEVMTSYVNDPLELEQRSSLRSRTPDLFLEIVGNGSQRETSCKFNLDESISVYGANVREQQSYSRVRSHLDKLNFIFHIVKLPGLERLSLRSLPDLG